MGNMTVILSSLLWTLANINFSDFLISVKVKNIETCYFEHKNTL